MPLTYIDHYRSLSLNHPVGYISITYRDMKFPRIHPRGAPPTDGQVSVGSVVVGDAEA